MQRSRCALILVALLLRLLSHAIWAREGLRLALLSAALQLAPRATRLRALLVAAALAPGRRGWRPRGAGLVRGRRAGQRGGRSD